MVGWPRIATVGTVAVFFIVAFLGLVLGGSFSRNLNPGRGEQCEALSTSTDPEARVLEHQNTWSNFGYLVAGILILYRSRNLFGAMLGFNLAFEFLFSSLYHAKLTEGVQTIDVAWIYVLMLALIMYAIQSLLFPDFAKNTGYWSVSFLIALIIEALIVVTGVLMGIYKNEVFESTVTTLVLVGLVFIFVVIVLIGTGIRLARAKPPVEGSTIAMAVIMPSLLILATGIPTIFFKFGDGPGHFKYANWCCPTAPLQSHAAWHILSAVLVLLAYDLFATFGKDARLFSRSDGFSNPW